MILHRALGLALLLAADADAAERLVVLHSVGQHEVLINPAQVTSMRPKLDDDDPNKLFTKEVQCMINLTDGRYVTVVETCDTARGLIDPQHQQ